jgi:hypothetical protein
MLDTVRQEMVSCGVASYVQVAGSVLAYHISKRYFGSNTTRFWGGRLKSGEVRRLLMPCNLDNVHWIVMEIDVESRFISLGDSMPLGRLQKAKDEAISGVKEWLREYLPEYTWVFSKHGVPIYLQRDGYSCGVATVNAIHKSVLPTTAAWSPEKPCYSRAIYYAKCIELGKEVC